MINQKQNTIKQSNSFYHCCQKKNRTLPLPDFISLKFRLIIIKSRYNFFLLSHFYSASNLPFPFLSYQKKTFMQTLLTIFSSIARFFKQCLSDNKGNPSSTRIIMLVIVLWFIADWLMEFHSKIPESSG